MVLLPDTIMENYEDFYMMDHKLEFFIMITNKELFDDHKFYIEPAAL